MFSPKRGAVVPPFIRESQASPQHVVGSQLPASPLMMGSPPPAAGSPQYVVGSPPHVPHGTLRSATGSPPQQQLLGAHMLPPPHAANQPSLQHAQPPSPIPAQQPAPVSRPILQHGPGRPVEVATLRLSEDLFHAFLSSPPPATAEVFQAHLAHMRDLIEVLRNTGRTLDHETVEVTGDGIVVRGNHQVLAAWLLNWSCVTCVASTRPAAASVPLDASRRGALAALFGLSPLPPQLQASPTAESPPPPAKGRLRRRRSSSLGALPSPQESIPLKAPADNQCRNESVEVRSRSVGTGNRKVPSAGLSYAEAAAMRAEAAMRKSESADVAALRLGEDLFRDLLEPAASIPAEVVEENTRYMKKLVEYMRESGKPPFSERIDVNEDGVVTGGNHRVLGAWLLRWEHIPCIRCNQKAGWRVPLDEDKREALEKLLGL